MLRVLLPAAGRWLLMEYGIDFFVPEMECWCVRLVAGGVVGTARSLFVAIFTYYRTSSGSGTEAKAKGYVRSRTKMRRWNLMFGHVTTNVESYVWL